MNQTNLRVQDNMVVSLAYIRTATNATANATTNAAANTMTGATTNVATETEQAEQAGEKQAALQVLQGRQKLVPGLEQALYGMAVGEEKDVVVDPTQGYGEIDPQAVRTLPRKSVPSFAQATPGQRLRLLHKSSGEIRRATVLEVQPETVVLDFNHPLAGKTLHYHVRVDDIRPATAEEMAQGQVARVQ